MGGERRLHAGRQGCRDGSIPGLRRCRRGQSEAQLDYFAAFTGTGPAYHALLADTLRLDAISRGVPPGIARRAATTLLIGSAKLMERDDRCRRRSSRTSSITRA
ncbi:hypothetical protein F2981_21510 (plasmid) [Sinorhizobium meliloti]|nr:hypothetical protein [Sinorhizobium meliloti]